jgi:hypothetical protein
LDGDIGWVRSQCVSLQVLYWQVTGKGLSKPKGL